MTALYRDRAAADAAVDKLKAYAQPQRLMILSCLLDGECTVSQIDAATKIGQPALSQQLAELRRAELVRTRKAAKAVFYSLANEETALCVRSMEAIFAGRDGAGQRLATLFATPLRPQPGSKSPPGSASFARVDRSGPGISR